MVMITWRVWATETLGADPEGLVVRSAGFCDVQDATAAQQTPHMQGVFVPQWNILLAVHRNSHTYHLKTFGESCLCLPQKLVHDMHGCSGCMDALDAWTHHTHMSFDLNNRCLGCEQGSYLNTFCAIMFPDCACPSSFASIKSLQLQVVPTGLSFLSQ